MGERKERRLRREAEAAAEKDRIEQEKAAQEQPEAENPAPEAEEKQPEQAEAERDHRENAPRRAPGEEAAPVRKRRRRAKINLQAAVVLLVFALLMGVVLGYVLGRSAGDRRAKEAEAKLAELTATVEPQQQAQLEQSAEQANEEALAALAGEALSSDGDSDLLMGAEDLSGAADAQLTDEVVAEFGGGELMASEVIEEYNARLARYLFEGYSEAEVSENLLREVMEDMVFERVLEAHAKELGVYELSASDGQQIAAEAKQRYEEQLGYARSLVRTGEMSDAEVEAAAQSYLLESEGVSRESIEAELRSSWWMDKLYDALTADVSVGSGEIMTAYNEALADQKERFLASSEDYEAAQVGGVVIVYNLPGYRRVKMVGLSFDSFDSMTAVDGLNTQLAALDASADAEQIAELQAQLDAYYAPLEERADALLQALASGGALESLSSQYGGELEEGCVCLGSSLWTQELVDAAMALANPGDVSGIVRTGDGVYILQYVEDVPEGTVAMSEVYDELSAQTLETARYLAYETQINTWMEEADPKYYPERMQ